MCLGWVLLLETEHRGSSVVPNGNILFIGYRSSVGNVYLDVLEVPMPWTFVYLRCTKR